MNKLDKELKSIIGTIRTGDVFVSANATQEDLSKIKEAFSNAGYMKPTGFPRGVYNFDGKRFTQIDSAKALTGKDWYDKFMLELPVIAPTSKYARSTIISAAKRATGGVDE